MGYALIGIVVVLLIAWIVIYNSVIGARNAVDSAFSSIDVMLKKRADLIPNLVASVQQYMQHEAGLLERIVQLRNTATSPGIAEGDRLQAEGQLSGALGQLRVAVENYPNLKANENFLQLQGALNESEEQISAARRAFNAAVLDYNNSIDMFPYSIVAGMQNFQRRAFFEIPESERKNVDVKGLFA
jgi:LemA protein